ncbi:MAG: PAS domain S-box protein [Herminiimonas sp.]|nr:PAS domain S-box protein [Herminiimonas sp.]
MNNDDEELSSLREEQFLADFFENGPVGMHWVGSDGILLRANRAEYALLGYAEVDYIGHHIAEFHADPDVIADILSRLGQGQTLHSHAARLRCKDGSIRHVLISSNVLWENGRFVHTRCFTRDVTEQKLAQIALERADQRKSAILSASLDAIVTMDHEGNIVDFNQAAERTFGYRPDEAIGKSVAQLLVPPALREHHARGLARYLEEGGSAILGKRIEMPALHAAGHEIPVELSICRIIGLEPPMFTATLRDVSDLKHALAAQAQLTQSEHAARAEAERMSTLKDEFLATLSHELRTPLSAILGWSQLLLRGNRDSTDLKKGLETIERNARAQAQLIDDLLDMSRITSGVVRLEMQVMEPTACIRAAIESVRPAAEAKGVAIVLLADPMIGAPMGTIAADPARLQQVMWNLLSNAVKFTPKSGQVTIAVQRVEDDVEIHVADSGIGISAEFLPHVFDRFRQADASTTRRFGGLGLGLAIVKHLTELHGGSVRVGSPGLGKGTTFSLRLPLRAPSQRESDPVAFGCHNTTASGVVDLSGVKVLVVDDEPDTREMIRRTLIETNAVVITTSAADEALSLVQSERPHVLVSDIGMPDVDGFELMRRVRALDIGHGGQTPAIALTAFASADDHQRALEAGFRVHVSKPVEATELVATVAEVAGRTPGKCSNPI